MSLQSIFWWALLLPIFLVLTSISGGPYNPEQPIAFSHRVHAGDYEIPCLYCHIYASRSTIAGIPSVERCWGCHRITAMNKPEVKKVQKYWNQKRAIPWIRVYAVPDFVYFSHKRHIRKGIICQQCHGAVETMDRVRRVSSLEMGWCVNCHIENKASIDCLTCHK